MKKIPRDKQLHFITGFFGGVLLGAVLPAPWAYGLMLIPGLAKEAWDAYRNVRAEVTGKPVVHVVEVMDAVATTLGGWLGVSITYLVHNG